MKTLLKCFLLAVSLICSIGYGQKNEINETLKNIKNRTAEDSLKVSLFIDASYLYQANNLDSAAYYANLAVEMAMHLQNKKLLCDAYNQQASNYVWKYAYDSALTIYLQSINIAQKNNYTNSLFNAYTGTAYLFEISANWDRAFYYNRKALEIASVTKQSDHKAYAYHGMSSVYFAMHNYSEAEKELRTALPLFRETQNEDRVATCYMDIAKIYKTTNRYKEGLVLLDSAIRIFTLLDEPLQLAEAFEGRAAILSSIGETQEAKHYYSQALNIYEANHLDANKYNLHLGLSTVYFATKEYGKAKKLLLEANAWFIEHHADEKQMESLLILARIDSAQSLQQHAFGYLYQYKQLSDKITQAKRDQYARHMLIEYEVEKKERENKLLREQNNRSRESLSIFIIAGLTLFFALGIMYLFYLQKKKLLKRLEITSIHTEEINKQLEQSNQIKNQLFSILAHDLRDPLANTLHLLKTLKTGDISESDFKLMTGYLESDLTYNNELLDNMLNWAKSQMEGIVLYRKKIDLQNIVNENIALFASVAAKKNIVLSNHIPNNTYIDADENILRLALRNTLSNSIKFSFDNQEIEIFSKIDNTGQVTLQVKDNGAGIAQKRLQNIFTRQIKSTRGTRKEKGAGLGLMITKEMLAYMETPLWIESTEGQGTVVFMQLKQAI